MPDFQDEIRYYAERIAAAETLAAKAGSPSARHVHEQMAQLYREKLAMLRDTPPDSNSDESTTR